VFHDDPEAGKPFVRWAFCKRPEVLDEALARLRKGVRMIERATTPEQVHEAAPLFDEPVRDDAVRRFLDDPTHHLLLARDEGRVVGFVSGVETTHPDKGTEMFLYELEVEEPARRRGHGRALVRCARGTGSRAGLLRHVGAHRRRQRAGAGDLHRGRGAAADVARDAHLGPRRRLTGGFPRPRRSGTRPRRPTQGPRAG